MSTDLAAAPSQFVLQRFGEGFHAGLGDIIGGIAGRVVMALLEPVLILDLGVRRRFMPGQKICEP